MKRILGLILITGLTFAGIGCIPNITDNVGTLSASLEVSGYPTNDTTSVSFSLSQLETGASSSRTVPTDDRNHSEGLFQNLEPGTWDLTVEFLDGDSVIGSHTFTVDILPGEETTATITGTYTGMSITFFHNVSVAGNQTNLEFTDIKGVIIEERRMWDSSEIDPEMWSQVTASGTFTSAVGGSALFPDGTTIQIGGGRGFSYGSRVEDTEMWASRSTGGDETAGTFMLNAYDINGIDVSGSTAVNTDLSFTSAPDPFNPIQGNDLGAGGINITVEWDMAASDGIASIYVVIIEDETAGSFDFAEYGGGFPSYIHTSGGLTTDGKNYDIYLIAVDEPLSSKALFTITNNTKHWEDIIRTILRDYESDVGYVGVARMSVTG